MSLSSPEASASETRAKQLVLWLESYMACDINSYDDFRKQSSSRSISSTFSEAFHALKDGPASDVHGIKRLTHPNEQICMDAWECFFTDMVMYLAGPNQTHLIDWNAEQKLHYVPGDTKHDHPLRIKLCNDGSFQEVAEWLDQESPARQRLDTVYTKVGMHFKCLTDYDRVGNALRAMKHKSSMDFYTEWWKQFTTNKIVPENVVIPKDGWPNISWDIFTSLAVDTQSALRKDKPSQAARAHKMTATPKKNTNEQQPTKQKSGPDVPKTTRDSGSTEKKVKPCFICKSEAHQTKDCPNRTGKPCNYFTQCGVCRHEANCQHEHVTGSQNPLEGFTPLPITGKQRTSCKLRCCDTCIPEFEIDVSVWGPRVNDKAKIGIKFELPKSCDACRAHSKLRNNSSSLPTSSNTQSTGDSPPSQQDTNPTSSCVTEFMEGDDACADDEYFIQQDLSMYDAMAHGQHEDLNSSLVTQYTSDFSFGDAIREMQEIEESLTCLVTSVSDFSYSSDSPERLDSSFYPSTVQDGSSSDSSSSSSDILTTAEQELESLEAIVGEQIPHTRVTRGTIPDAYDATISELMLADVGDEVHAAILNDSLDLDTSMLSGAYPENLPVTQNTIGQYFSVRQSDSDRDSQASDIPIATLMQTQQQIPKRSVPKVETFPYLSTNSDAYYDHPCMQCGTPEPDVTFDDREGRVGCSGCLDNKDSASLPLSTLDHFRSTNSLEFLASVGFYSDCASPSGWTPLAVNFDTLSMTNLFEVKCIPDPLPEDWSWDKSTEHVTGAGDVKSPTFGSLTIPKWKFTWLGQEVPMLFTMLSLPRGAQVVIGTHTMFDPKLNHKDGLIPLDIVPDLSNFRVYIMALKETVRLDWLPRTLNRLHSRPINVLSWYGGVETGLYAMLELGFRINLYFSIERDSVARSIAKQHYPPIVHCAQGDALLVSASDIPQQVWDVIIGTPPCRLLSRRNSSPQYDVSLFKAMMKLSRTLMGFESAHKFFENVYPADKLTELGIVQHLDEIVGIVAQRHDAIKSGSLATRDRLYWDSHVDIDLLPMVAHRFSQVCFEEGYSPQHIPLEPLLAAGTQTEFVTSLKHRDTRELRHLTSDERDRVHPGFAAGFSGPNSIPESVRNIANGSSLSADVLWNVMRHWKLPIRDTVPSSLMTAQDVYSANPDALELYFMNITPLEGSRYAAILAFLQRVADSRGLLLPNGKMDTPKLHMTTSSTETLPSRVQHDCAVPAKLTAAASYCIQNLVRDGSHTLPSFDPDMWLSMLFFQPKGRTEVAEYDDLLWGFFKKGDKLEALRPLKDLRVPNRAGEAEIPEHWSVSSPDRFVSTRHVPKGTTKFKPYDAKHAYHAVRLDDESKKHAVSTCKLVAILVILQAECGSQGNNWMGTYFPAWLDYIFTVLLCMAHYSWVLKLIDDMLCHAPDEERCQLRFEVVHAVMHLAGFSHTDKYQEAIQAPCVDTVVHAGIKWTPDGHCISDEVIDVLRVLLSQTPKSGKHLLKIRGMINQCTTAFVWSSDDRHSFIRLMAPINDASTAVLNGEKHVHTEQMADTMASIAACLTNMPRQYCHPDWIVSDTRCLVGQGVIQPKVYLGCCSR